MNATRQKKRTLKIVTLTIILIGIILTALYFSFSRTLFWDSSKEILEKSMNRIPEKEYEEMNAMVYDVSYEYIEKGYDLPIEESQKKIAIADCTSVMETIIPAKTVKEKMDLLKKQGKVAVSNDVYSDMTNYEQMEHFLDDCKQGVECKIIVYEIQDDDKVTRMEYYFDGEEMYVLTSIGKLDETAVISSISYNRIKQWDYTEKGWFAYEVCMPEYPEVSETTPAYELVKVKPWNKTYRKICQQYLLPIGYNGDTTFLVDWDNSHKDSVKKYNAFPSYLGTSIPEITKLEEKEDGSIVLTIDAVCEMLYTDCAMTHQLTVRFLENGKMECLSNKILKPYE